MERMRQRRVLRGIGVVVDGGVMLVTLAVRALFGTRRGTLAVPQDGPAVLAREAGGMGNFVVARDFHSITRAEQALIVEAPQVLFQPGRERFDGVVPGEQEPAGAAPALGWLGRVAGLAVVNQLR